MESYAKRKADAEAMYRKPAGADHATQQFARGEKVKIDDEMPSCMSHFPCGVEAIIQYSYKQKYGGALTNGHSYSLILLDKDGVPFNSSAWYSEDHLTSVDKNLEKGLKIINSYKLSA